MILNAMACTVLHIQISSQSVTRPVVVYMQTLQFRLEKSVSHQRTRQVTQLFTYLLTHNLF